MGFNRVGFIGKAGSGKSTLAHALTQHPYFTSNGNVQILSFATPIKEIVDEIGLERGTEEHRRACQIFGQYLREKVDEEWWVRILGNNITQNCIVDDVRYTNEADMLAYEDFYLVYLDVPDEVRFERRPDLVDDGIINHSSESEIDKFKRQYTNLRLVHPFTVEEAVERIINGIQTFTGNW